MKTKVGIPVSKNSRRTLTSGLGLSMRQFQAITGIDLSSLKDNQQVSVYMIVKKGTVMNLTFYKLGGREIIYLSADRRPEEMRSSVPEELFVIPSKTKILDTFEKGEFLSLEKLTEFLSNYTNSIYKELTSEHFKSIKSSDKVCYVQVSL